MSLLLPPRNLITWSATSLTTSFGGYRVYRRPARAAALPWSMIADITVPTGYTAATVEAQHTRFTDYTAGWAATGGQYADGWDYAVTVINAVTGLESTVGSSTDLANAVTADTDAWLVSNGYPWLNTPLEAAHSNDSATDDAQRVYRVAGRDFAVTRTRAELPPRTWRLSWRRAGQIGEDFARYPKAAAATGAEVTVLTQRGDAATGTLSAPGIAHGLDPMLDLDATLTETARTPAAVDYNHPAGIVTNGSTSYAAATYSSAFNPGSSPFSIVYCGTFQNTADKAVMGAISGGFTRYYALTATGSNGFKFEAAGASATATASETSSTWFDGNRHVAVGTSSGTAQVLYRDGAQAGTASTTHGAIDISSGGTTPLSAGCTGAGIAAAAVTAQAFAYYARVLTATEARDASYYLLGFPGYRMPYGPVVFFDLRDDRCWNGTSTLLTDLSGNRVAGTLTGSPSTRGIPWALDQLERF